MLPCIGDRIGRRIKPCIILPTNDLFALRVYIKDIAQWHKDMNFIFLCWKQYVMNECSKRIKYHFHHKKISNIIL